MTEERNGMERSIVDAGWVDLPGDLRGRVVAAAAAAVRESQRAGWFDRVWYSTRWRVATAATLLAVALLNWIPANTDTGVADGFGRAAYEVAEDAAAAARQLGLPDAYCQRLGDAALVAASRPTRDDAFGGKEQGNDGRD
jgi:hypothetical protein